MKTIREYKEKTLLGVHDGEKIYLSHPSWDCNWYWCFGYLGNSNCNYHVEGLKTIKSYNFEKQVWQHEVVNLYDGFKKHFGDSFVVKNDKDIWALAELFGTFYTLKEAAEGLERGGSNYTTNPCKDTIINKDEVERINNIVLPAIFDEIYKILESYAKP